VKRFVVSATGPVVEALHSPNTLAPIAIIRKEN
jgi:hypothetical protein